MTIADPDFLSKLLLSFMERRLAVNIVPQMSSEKPWLVEVEVPALEGQKVLYFQEPVLEWALEKALDEYDRRARAQDVLAGQTDVQRRQRIIRGETKPLPYGGTEEV